MRLKRTRRRYLSTILILPASDWALTKKTIAAPPPHESRSREAVRVPIAFSDAIESHVCFRRVLSGIQEVFGWRPACECTRKSIVSRLSPSPKARIILRTKRKETVPIFPRPANFAPGQAGQVGNYSGYGILARRSSLAIEVYLLL